MTTTLAVRLYSIVVVRQSCKLKVPGSNPGGGIVLPLSCLEKASFFAFITSTDETIIYLCG